MKNKSRAKLIEKFSKLFVERENTEDIVFQDSLRTIRVKQYIQNRDRLMVHTIQSNFNVFVQDPKMIDIEINHRKQGNRGGIGLSLFRYKNNLSDNSVDQLSAEELEIVFKKLDTDFTGYGYGS